MKCIEMYKKLHYLWMNEWMNDVVKSDTVIYYIVFYKNPFCFPFEAKQVPAL